MCGHTLRRCGILTAEVITLDYVQLGQRVRISRMAAGLTQERLAERINVSTSFVGHIERGTRRLSVETLHRLCVVLGVSSDYLLGTGQ